MPRDYVWLWPAMTLHKSQLGDRPVDVDPEAQPLTLTLF